MARAGRRLGWVAFVEIEKFSKRNRSLFGIISVTNKGRLGILINIMHHEEEKFAQTSPPSCHTSSHKCAPCRLPSNSDWNFAHTTSKRGLYIHFRFRIISHFFPRQHSGCVIRLMGRMALKHSHPEVNITDLLRNMKAFTSLLALATAAHAHYNFPSIVYNGVSTPAWAAVRQWTNYYTYQPVQDVTSLDLRLIVILLQSLLLLHCQVLPVPRLLSPFARTFIMLGPALSYMARVPSGKTAANWNGSGAVWFKIYQLGPQFGGQALVWPTDGTLPSPIPPR